MPERSKGTVSKTVVHALAGSNPAGCEPFSTSHHYFASAIHRFIGGNMEGIDFSAVFLSTTPSLTHIAD